MYEGGVLVFVVSDHFLLVLPFTDMNTDSEWFLDNVNSLFGQYVELVRRQILPDGVCWAIRSTERTAKRLPNAVPITTALGMSDEMVKRVWRSLGKSPAKRILNYFGNSAIITDHGGTMTLIFRTPTFDDNLASTAKERFATADTLEHFTLRLSRRPRATLAPAPDQGPPATGSPRRSPPRAARPAPSSPTKRSSLPSFLAPGSPPKKHKLDMEFLLKNFTQLDLKNPEENLILHEGKVYINNLYSPKLVARSMKKKQEKAWLVTNCVDQMVNRSQAALPTEVKEIIAAFISMNPQIPMAKVEMLLGLGRYATFKELDSLVENYTGNEAAPKPGKYKWSTGIYKISMDHALNGSQRALGLLAGKDRLREAGNDCEQGDNHPAN